MSASRSARRQADRSRLRRSRLRCRARRHAARRDTGACASSAWSTSRCCSGCRSASSSCAPSTSGIEPAFWRRSLKPDFQHAFWLTVTCDRDRRAAQHDLRRHHGAHLVRRRFRGRDLLNALIDLPFALSPVVIGLSLLLVYGSNGLFGPVLTDAGLPASSSRCRAWSSRRSSCRCRSWRARSCPCCARSAPTRRRPPTRSAHRRGARSGA